MKTFYFFDPAFTKAVTNVKVVPGKVKKYGKPLFTEGRYETPRLEWEVRYDNGYPNVFFDPEKKIYRCYYLACVQDFASEKTSLAERATGIAYKPVGRRVTALLYAESQDGIHWDRPALGVTEFRGSRANNIIRLYAHGSCVFYDHHESDPAKRYKLFTRDDHSLRKLCTAYSADGIHFSTLEPIPKTAYATPGDTHNYVIWDEKLNRYVLLTRTFSRELRTVARSESIDCRNWEPAQEVFKGNGLDDQIYAMPFFRDGDMFFGLPAIYHAGDTELEHHDCVDIQLAFSGDSIHWERIAAGVPLIPRGKGTYANGDYDCGCCFPCPPVDDGEQWRFYYMGGNGRHYGFRETSLCMATMPKHKIAGVVPADHERAGIFETQTLLLNATGIELLADIAEDGYLEAELVTPELQTMEGYSYESFSMKEKDGSYQMLWNGKPCDIVHEEFRIRIRFKNVMLYSISGDVDFQLTHPLF